MTTHIPRSIFAAGIMMLLSAAVFYILGIATPSAPANPGPAVKAEPVPQSQPAEFSQVVRFISAKRVGLLAAVIKGANGANKPVYEPGVAISICSPSCEQTARVYMWNSCPDAHNLVAGEKEKGRFARGDYIKVFVDNSGKSGRITLINAVEPYTLMPGEDHPDTFILTGVSEAKGQNRAEYLRVDARKFGKDYSFAVPVKMDDGSDADDNMHRVAKAIRSIKAGRLIKVMPAGVMAGMPILIDVQPYGPVEKAVMTGTGKISNGKAEFDSIIMEIDGKAKELPIPMVLMMTARVDQPTKPVTDPVILASAKAIPKGQSIEFSALADAFSNNFINGIHAIPTVPLAVNVGAGGGGGGADQCLGYILVGTMQAYVANVSQTAGTGAVANNYTIGWLNSGSCFTVFDAVVELN